MSPETLDSNPTSVLIDDRDPVASLQFARIALARGFCTGQAIASALRHLTDHRNRGGSCTLGQILVRQRALTPVQFAEIHRILLDDAVRGTGDPEDPETSVSSIGGLGSLLGTIDWTGHLERIRAVHAERFDILEEVGRGGMGIVYRAHRRSDGQLVAVKVLSRGVGGPRMFRRFRREARVAMNLDHPSIVRTHDFGESNGVPYIVQEFVEGQTLSGWMSSRPDPVPIGGALRIFRSTVEAVEHAHEKGVVHRDIKPGNIMVRVDGSPCLTDFGLARQEGDITISGTGDLIGTPAYMAPEQVERDGSRIGPATDVYALGVVLFEMLVGRPPFEERTAEGLFRSIVEIDPPRVSTLRPGVDPRLDEICARCLEKNPRDRYPSATALREDLSRYLRGQSWPAIDPTAGTRRRLRRLTRLARRRLPVGAVLGACLGGLLTLALIGLPLASRRLVIETTPGDAEIRVDGQPIGSGRIDRRYWFGSPDRVEVVRDGHRGVAFEIDLRPGATYYRTVALAPDEGGPPVARRQNLWERRSRSAFLAPPALGDLDGNGTLDVVVPTAEGVLALDGPRGERLWSTPIPDLAGTPGRPTLVDLTGDGRPDVVLSVGPDLLAIASDGRILWLVECPGETLEGRLTVDVDGDGDMDLLVTSSGSIGLLAAIDGRSGVTIWRRKGLRVTAVGTGDIDGDGLPELIAFDEESRNLLIRRAADGQAVSRIRSDIPLAGPFLVADLDGDGKADIAALTTEGHVVAVGGEGQLWSGGRSVDASSLALMVRGGRSVLLAHDPDYGLTALDGSSGGLLWRVRLPRLEGPVEMHHFPGLGQILVTDGHGRLLVCDDSTGASLGEPVDLGEGWPSIGPLDEDDVPDVVHLDGDYRMAALLR